MTKRTTEVPRISWAEVCARRLERQALSTPRPNARPAAIVSAMCGAHAQVFSAAEWSLGLRIPGITRDEISDALWNERSLVKTFGPRGTVHLLSTQDLGLWIGALSAIPFPRTHHAKNIQLTPEQTNEVVAAIARALADAELTIDELSEAVITTTGPWAGDLVMPAFGGMWPRWRMALTPAAHRGVLCFGPNRGRNVTYTNPQRWVPGFQPVSGQTAIAELVKHYLSTYGPATPQHFAQWLAVPQRWATAWFDSLAPELQPVEVSGILSWQVVEDTTPPTTDSQSVRLLPYFDAYVVGSQPRELLFPGQAAKRALSPNGQAGNFPVVFLGGTVGGLWQQRRTGRILDITVEPFEPLTAAQRSELDDQVALSLQDQFWGDRHGQISDPFGYRWGLAQHIHEISSEEIAHQAAQVFGGQG